MCYLCPIGLLHFSSLTGKLMPKNKFENHQNLRQQQKKKSRERNDITTMQLSRSLKARLTKIQNHYQFDKKDEALDEVLSFYEDNHELTK